MPLPKLTKTDQAAIIRLVKTAGLTYRQIAQRIGCCPATVKRYREMAGLPDRRPRSTAWATMPGRHIAGGVVEPYSVPAARSYPNLYRKLTQFD